MKVVHPAAMNCEQRKNDDVNVSRHKRWYTLKSGGWPVTTATVPRNQTDMKGSQWSVFRDDHGVIITSRSVEIVRVNIVRVALAVSRSVEIVHVNIVRVALAVDTNDVEAKQDNGGHTECSPIANKMISSLTRKNVNKIVEL
jgi:hypothetical protein